MHVVLLAAQSLDGRITRGELAGDAFTSDADKAHFRTALRACDACIMGSTTYTQTKDRLRPDLLPGLRRIVRTRNPGAHASETVPGVLEFSTVTPAEIVAFLRADGRRRCALLGGGKTNGDFLRAGLVDEICLTVESWIFGAGTPLAGTLEAGDGDDAAGGEAGWQAVRLDLIEAKTLAPGGPVLLRYVVKR